jgi:hypothetical protein
MRTRPGYAIRLALLASACCAAQLGIAAASASAAVPACTRYASPPPAGSPAGSGTKVSPYGSVQQLVNSMAPGEVGCLTADATFGETVNVSNRLGTADKPFVVRSEDPAHPATISAVADSSTLAVVYIGPTASHFELSGVNVHALPSAGTPAITIAGDSNAVDGADITDSGNGTCVQIGPSADRRATNARLDGNAVHSCGNPSGGHADAVGISYADGTTIANSYLYGSPRHGITMFPDAQHSEIAHNVIDRLHNGMGDGEGVQFAGDNTTSSSNNVVEANVISDSEFVNVGYNWNDGSGTPGTGNVVHGNCISNSGNTNGEFQVDATTHQPVGYSQDANTVGSDPQYVSRDAPPSGYALSATSPCLGLGPVATATTDPALVPAPDPEAASVFTATLAGDVDPHLQPATFHFEWGLQQAPALSALPGQQIGAVGMPTGVLSQQLTGLKPLTTYAYRIVPDSPTGSAPGQTVTFTTAAAPNIAPPIPTIVYSTHVTKKGVVLKQLTVRNVPAGDVLGAQCLPVSQCPFDERFGAENLHLLVHRTYRRGARIGILLVTPNPVGRYLGRVTALTIGRPDPKHPARSVKRTDSCLVGVQDTPCLRAVAQFLSFPGYLRFTRFAAVRVPRGATVDFRCVQGKCPRFPSCRSVASGFREVKLLSKTAGRRVKPGAVFDVRVLKPDTSGLVNRFTIRKRGGNVVAEQKSFFVPTGVQHTGTCADA